MIRLHDPAETSRPHGRLILPTRMVPLAVLPLVLLVSGCITHGGFSSLVVAPDHSAVAYVSESTLLKPPIVDEVMTFRHDIYLHLVDTDRPSHHRTIWLGAFGLYHVNQLSIPAKVLFSGDSRYVAVLASDRLWVVNAQSGRSRCMNQSGRHVTSVAWSNPDLLAYGTLAVETKGGTKSACKAFWVADPAEASHPRQVYSGPGLMHQYEAMSPVLEEWDRWSPDGRYVIFADQASQGRAAILDVQSSRSQAFSEDKCYGLAVAWKPDSSAAFCAAGKRGGMAAYLLSVSGSQIVDVSSNATDLFGDRVPHLGPVWTSDGQYVIIEYVAGKRGILVQPAPWRVLDTGSVVTKKLGMDANDSPGLSPLCSGWLVGIVLTPKEQAGLYAISYDGQEQRLLASGCNIAWAISPDGQMLVRADAHGKMTIHRLGPMPPATSQRS